MQPVESRCWRRCGRVVEGIPAVSYSLSGRATEIFTLGQYPTVGVSGGLAYMPVSIRFYPHGIDSCLLSERIVKAMLNRYFQVVALAISVGLGWASLAGASAMGGSAESPTTTIDVGGAPPAEFAPSSFSFGGTDTGFACKSACDLGRANLIDTVTPVPAPEPGTLVLLSLGLVGLAATARRKRK